MTDTWTWATVTQAIPLRIKVDGDTSALDATTDNLVGSLAVSDRVRVHLHADGIIVTGLQGGGPPEPGSIPDNANLDGYTTPGLWHQDANTQAATGTNYPTPHAGLLEVFSVEGSYPFYYQRYTPYGPQIAVYQRTFYNGTWYGWNLVGGNDTGWVDMTLASGVTGSAKYRAKNGTITVQFDTTFSTSGDINMVESLPTEYRFTSGVGLVGAATYFDPVASRATAVVYIGSNGFLRVTGGGSTVTRARGGVSWVY